MKPLLSRSWMLGLVLCLCGGIRAGGASAGNAPAPEVIARIHSRGIADLTNDSNGRVFKEIWNLPATAQLRDESFDKLAGAWATRFLPKKQGTPADCAHLLRPLFLDLLNAELLLEVTEPSPARLGFTLALRLDPARASVWQNNWNQLISDFNLRSGQGTLRLSTLTNSGWFVVQGTSSDPSNSGQAPKNAIIEQIKQNQRPVPKAQDYWWNLEFDLARLSWWFSPRGRDDLPRVDWTIVGRNEYLRSQARLSFREPTAPHSQTWDIPIKTIQDPLISFTAIQGIAPWLQRQPVVQNLGLETIPDQLYLWGLSQTAFQIQAAMPFPNASNAFERVVQKGMPKWNQTLAEYAVGNIFRLPDRPELVWRGLPILVPYLNPVQDEGHGFLHAGIFPVKPPTNAPPQQLFEQLTSRTNLLYYDWEITQSQLNQLRPLLQLSAVFLTISPMSTNSAAFRWLDAVEPRLGNAVTEVSVVSPKELSVLRTSHLGLNGLELLTLANWLEGTNFPKLNLDIHYRPIIKSKRQKEAH